MKKLLFLLTFVGSLAISAQEKGAVAGEILDAELQNEPLLFANVSLIGTDKLARTNFWGRFELTDIAPGDYVLRVDFLGYESLEIPIVVKNNEILQVSGGLKTKKILSEDIPLTEDSATGKS